MVATTTPEQTKTGRSFSQFGRKSIGCSAFIPDGGGTGAPQGKNLSPSTIQEEALRVFKNSKSEHIKNYTVRGTRGESIGLLLVEMASKFVHFFYSCCYLSVKFNANLFQVNFWLSVLQNNTTFRAFHSFVDHGL